jgi:hypothetical protein
LLAEALPDISKDQVWRILRRHDICLERRRSWCISTDPEFGPKAADIVGLYLNPPQNALRDRNGNRVSGWSNESQRIDQVCPESIGEEHHQLIHNYIPSLAFGPAIGEVANIQE